MMLMTVGHVQTRNSPMKVDELAEKISENERCAPLVMMMMMMMMIFSTGSGSIAVFSH